MNRTLNDPSQASAPDNPSAASAPAARPSPRMALKARTYPETNFGGFSRWDGSVAFLNRVHAIAPETGVVLDVGCGRGAASDDTCAWRRRLADLRRPGRHVIGIDVDTAGAANPIIDEFRPIAADMRWPVESASVDCAIARSVLEHVPDPQAFFRELARVLRPGGCFAAHTPNRFSYSSIAATIVPNRYHAKVVGKVQDSRAEHDVFPTVFRVNTKRKLRSVCAQHGLDCYVYAWEAEPSYLTFSPLLYRLGALVHRLIPQPFQTVLFVWARKR